MNIMTSAKEIACLGYSPYRLPILCGSQTPFFRVLASKKQADFFKLPKPDGGYNPSVLKQFLSARFSRLQL